MGHSVTGLVATPELLAAFAREHSLHDPVMLGAGLALLPLTDDDLDSFLSPPMGEIAKGFVYLSDQLMGQLKSWSHDGAIVYFETDYFGGIGTQGAAAFRHGDLVFGPKAAKFGPINQALAFLGVRRAWPRDLFETVGLHRHRETEDWLGVEGQSGV